jgi:Mn2+/Fe2+ NRAMP family transporter
MEAKAFYCALTIASIIGIIINFLPVDPIRALYWSAVINGILAAPIMTPMLLLASRRDVMGRFTLSVPMKIIGWIATLAMSLAVVGLIATAGM